MEAIESSKLIAESVFNKILEEVKWNNQSRWLISIDFSKHVKNISVEILNRYSSIEFRHDVLIDLKSLYIFYFSQHNLNSILQENILQYIQNKINLETERKETIIINSELLKALIIAQKEMRELISNNFSPLEEKKCLNYLNNNSQYQIILKTIEKAKSKITK